MNRASAISGSWLVMAAFKKLFFTVLSVSALRRSNLLKHLFPWLVLELWVGLKPVCRRVWAPRGKAPLAWVRPRYGWVKYGLRP